MLKTTDKQIIRLKVIYRIISLLILFIAISDTNAQIMPWQTEEHLQKSEAQSLAQLKKSLKEDGFSSAMGSLNVWRSNAKDAGTFDQAVYDDFRKQIYHKSIDNILKWFEACLKEGWVDEANFCCKIYSFKSNAIDSFDQMKYEEMGRRIKILEKKKNEEKKKKRGAK